MNDRATLDTVACEDDFLRRCCRIAEEWKGNQSHDDEDDEDIAAKIYSPNNAEGRAREECFISLKKTRAIKLNLLHIIPARSLLPFHLATKDLQIVCALDFLRRFLVPTPDSLWLSRILS